MSRPKSTKTPEQKKRDYERTLAYIRKNPDKKREQNRRYRLKNLERERERLRVYRDENLEKARERLRVYRAENLEKMRVLGRDSEERRRKEKPDAVKEIRLRYEEVSRDKAKAKNHNYRARRRQSQGNFTPQEWKSLCEQYGNVCVSCGQSKPLTVDHVVPLSKGGTNYISNIQPLCMSCNCSKCDKEIDYRSER